MNKSTISINIPPRPAAPSTAVRFFAADIATGSDSALEADSVEVGPLGNVMAVVSARGPLADKATSTAIDTVGELFSPGRVAGLVMNSHDGVNRFMSGVVAEMHRRMLTLTATADSAASPAAARMLRASAGMLWMIGRRVYICCCGDISSTLYSDDDGSTSTLVSADRSYLGDPATLHTAATLRVPYLLTDGDTVSLTESVQTLLSLRLAPAVAPPAQRPEAREVEPEPVTEPEPKPAAKPELKPQAEPQAVAAEEAGPRPKPEPRPVRKPQPEEETEVRPAPARPRGVDWKLVGLVLSLVAVVLATSLFFLWTGSDNGPGTDSDSVALRPAQVSESIVPDDYDPASAIIAEPADTVAAALADTAAAMTARPEPAVKRTYTVVKGDNSWRLVAKHINEKYGTSFSEQEIRDAQPEKVGKSDVIYLDAELIVPDSPTQSSAL